MRPQFWELPLASLDHEEWEALCDGCGRCCLHKLEDEDTGVIVHTMVACRLLDTKRGCCSDYAERWREVPDCLRVTVSTVESYSWLPPTCAYRLRAQGEPLPAWHPLLTGDPESVIAAGVSVAGRVIREDTLPALVDWEDYVVAWPGQWPESPPARCAARRGPAKPSWPRR